MEEWVGCFLGHGWAMVERGRVYEGRGNGVVRHELRG